MRGLLVAALAVGFIAPPAAAQWTLPEGLSLIYQTEYSYGKLGEADDDNDGIFENWLNIDYTRGPVTGGLRFVAFNPPDPSVYDGPDSYGVDFAYGEYSHSRLNARGGNFYALFGRGLALRSYENRTLRVDTNMLGARATGYLPHGEISGVIGTTVEGNAEDADRGRTEALAGADFEYALPFGFRGGGSLVTTDVRNLGDEQDLEPQRMKAARLSRTLFGVDLYGEFARVDGPATLAGAAAPNVHGTGFYGVASSSIGRFGLVAEVKDYDRLVFDNEAGLDYILPPAVLREHTYNLLNRHPHQLDTSDEVGFQFETTYNTDAISDRGLTSFLANWSLTRNHDPDRQPGNHFDDVYAEAQQELGDGKAAIAGLSFQRTFDSNQTPDPLLTLWTPVADLRWPLSDRYGLHFQFEHQHASADRLGSFDTEFIVIEATRSPNLTASMLAEFSNKSETQLTLQNETETSFLGGEVSYHLLDQHELTLFFGARNAGFICVGGVCRFEPAFDGAELKWISRF
jgi:hypothetical protein